MTMRMIAARHLCVLLEPEDLADLSLTEEDLALENRRCRQALHQLLELARQELGYLPAGTRLSVEVYPWLEGGCALYFSPSEEERPQQEPGRLVFSFETLDDLLQGIGALFPTYCHRIFQSSLYRMERRWWLLLTVFDQWDEAVPACLTEYGRSEDLAGAGARLEEHGESVIIGNAIEKLAFYLTGSKEI